MIPRPVLSNNDRRKRWRREMIGTGRCGQCGNLREHYADRCDPCGLQARIKQRERHGGQAWIPGGKGRPPKTANAEK